MPEPIITPTTTITESKRPRPRAKVGSCGVATGRLENATGVFVVIHILVNLVVRSAPRRLERRCGRR